MFFRYNTLIRRARAHRLSREEKTAQQADLMAFMDAHPVRARVAPRLLAHGFRGRLVPALVALLVISAGAGTVSAAERALPTQFLYPVKIHVTEPVLRQLARSPEAKAELDATLALRRLDEARRLAATGALTTSTKADLTERFEVQASRVDASLKALRNEGKPERADHVADRLERAVERQNWEVEEESHPSSDIGESLLPVLKEAKQRVKRLRKEERQERNDDRRTDRQEDASSVRTERRDRSKSEDEPEPSRRRSRSSDDESHSSRN